MLVRALLGAIIGGMLGAGFQLVFGLLFEKQPYWQPATVSICVVIGAVDALYDTYRARRSSRN